MSARNMMNMRIPKRRKAHFDVRFKIIDLNNVPLVAGQVFVKWQHLHTDFRGRTEKEDIREHKVSWNQEAESNAWISINRSGHLHESWLQFDVIQEYTLENGKDERVDLGTVKLNLAQFVETCEAENENVCQRYLLQNSKINSTLKVSIFLRQTKGDRDFIAPPLKRIQAFNGIAGILVGDKAHPEEPTGFSSQFKSHEVKQQHDLYRKLLPARWAALPGQLSAEQCVEHIFAGGDGWGHRPGPKYGGTPREVHGGLVYGASTPDISKRPAGFESTVSAADVLFPSAPDLSEHSHGVGQFSTHVPQQAGPRYLRPPVPNDYPPELSRSTNEPVPPLQPSFLGFSNSGSNLGISNDSAHADASGESDGVSPFHRPYFSYGMTSSRPRSPLISSAYHASRHPSFVGERGGGMFGYNSSPVPDTATYDDYISSGGLAFWAVPSSTAMPSVTANEAPEEGPYGATLNHSWR